jgi:DNA-binding transcriptional MocR family regulator
MDRPVHGQLAANGLVQLIGAWSDTEGPLYRRLADGLRAAIARGDLSIGQLLPPERLLARHLAISRSTVVTAYELLRDEGLLERRQGSGTRVHSAPVQPARGAGLDVTLNRNTLFRRMTEGSGSTIDLTGAYLLEPGGLPDDVLRGFQSDLSALVETSGYSPLGYMPLRQAIAAHLTSRGVPTGAEQVLVTSGAQQAIYLAGWLFLERGDTALVENPTYPGALDAFSALGARLLGVPTRRQGVDLERLADNIVRQSPRLIYLIPTHQNPVGGVLHEHGRQVLAALVQKHQVPLIEDDSLSGLGTSGEPPRPVAAFGPGAPILTVGSLSKLCWAGLRVGWIRASEPTIAQLGRLKAVADLGGALPAQVIGARLLASYDEIQRERAPIIRQRLELVTHMLQQMLPSWSWDRPQGGLCLWVRLPYGSATEFTQLALRNGVSIVAGSVASCDGSFGGHLRLPFGHRPDTLEEGIRRLAQAWQAYAPADEVRAENLAVIV